MSRRPILAILVGLTFVSPCLAQEKPKEELVDQVKGSIDRAVRYLRQQQRPGGDWERGAALAGIGGTQGGPTCLAMLALLTAGVSPNDPVIQTGLKYLRSLPPTGTYVVGLQTMVFAEAGFPQDKLLIQNNVDWLYRNAIVQGRQLLGWSYGAVNGGGDNSNTQYALLGLHAGKQAGAKIPDEFWGIIRDFYRTTQNPNGCWGYTPGDQSGRLTMTMAGLCGLYIAGLELHEGQQQFDKKTGIAKRCGTYKENEAIAAAHKWISDGRFTFEPTQYVYYNIYGIERTGRLSGQRFLANRDWYRDGCEELVKKQQDDGSWSGQGLDAWTNVSTAFALLFLSKGRTPILVSKLAWGARDEWNNKHYDMKHVVDYASRQLFKGVPLAWQVHDGRKLNQNQLTAEVGDLLSSPILYLNGHEAPALTGLQKEMFKRYIQEGGFVLAEACCGSKDFVDGFRDLMKELFEKEMTPLPADHAIYKAHALVDPTEFPLERLDLGCKTVVILSPKPLAGWWEENLYQQKDGRGHLAFRLAGNIVAYATNMEVPQPRLRRQAVLEPEKDNVKLPRGFLKVAQIRHAGDWQPAPQAMRNLMAHLRLEAKLDLALATDAVSITGNNLFQYRFLYMHGRKRFDFTDGDLKNLRANLRTGGLLLADACCGSKEFDASFRTCAQRLFPDAKLEAIPLGDELFGKELNGVEIRSVKCRVPKPEGGASEIKAMPPALEGIKINGRWAVIYSKYDLGCALEKHPSSDCIGHDHDSALKLAGAAVLYYLKK